MSIATSAVGSPSETASITSAPTLSSTTSPTGTPSSTSSRAPQVHTVKAGAGGFKFEPAELKNVSVGDKVTFEFYPPDHSVARAEFGSACVPYENTGKGKVGFWSETQWVDSSDDLTYYTITINSTEPIFYYCAAPKSCIEKKMIGVINPNDTQTLDKQIIAAGEADFQLAPGEDTPKEASSTSVPPGSSPTGAPAAATKHGVHLSGGAIAGIVVGAVAFLALCAALFFYVGRTKSLKEMIKRKDATVTKTTPDPNQPGYPGSPGFPPSPFSPSQSHAEYGGNLPPYGQHNATDAYPSTWASPAMQQGHVSGQQQMTDIKYGHSSNVPVEMPSPAPGDQQGFTAELEAPQKSPR